MMNGSTRGALVPYSNARRAGMHNRSNVPIGIRRFAANESLESQEIVG
jgi:hypothetical protein